MASNLSFNLFDTSDTALTKRGFFFSILLCYISLSFDGGHSNYWVFSLFGTENNPNLIYVDGDRIVIGATSSMIAMGILLILRVLSALNKEIETIVAAEEHYTEFVDKKRRDIRENAGKFRRASKQIELMLRIFADLFFPMVVFSFTLREAFFHPAIKEIKYFDKPWIFSDPISAGLSLSFLFTTLMLWLAILSLTRKF